MAIITEQCTNQYLYVQFLYDHKVGWILLSRMYSKNWEGNSAKSDWRIEASPPANECKGIRSHTAKAYSHECQSWKRTFDLSYSIRESSLLSITMTYFVHPGMGQIGLCHALQHVHVLIQASLYQHLKSVNIQYGTISRFNTMICYRWRKSKYTPPFPCNQLLQPQQ